MESVPGRSQRVSRTVCFAGAAEWEACVLQSRHHGAWLILVLLWASGFSPKGVYLSWRRSKVSPIVTWGRQGQTPKKTCRQYVHCTREVRRSLWSLEKHSYKLAPEELDKLEETCAFWKSESAGKNLWIDRVWVSVASLRVLPNPEGDNSIHLVAETQREWKGHHG